MTKQVRGKRRDGVVQRGKKWCAVVRVPNPLTGEMERKWLSGFATQAEAKEARDRMREQVRNNTYVVPKKTTLGEFLSRWIDVHAEAKPLKKTTETHYRQKIDRYIKPALGNIEIQALRPAHIQKFYLDLKSGKVTGKPLVASTVRSCKAILNEALDYAVAVECLIPRNPGESVRAPKVESQAYDCWSNDEMKRFLDAVKEHRLFALFWLAANTGARRGEILALRWSDLDLEEGSVSISKSRVKAGTEEYEQDGTKSTRGGFRSRVVPIDPQTVSVLKAHRKQQLEERFRLGEAWQDTGYVFTREDGQVIVCDTPGLTLRRYRKRLGLPDNSFHDIRHWHATALLERGYALHAVAERLGHGDPMVTAKFYAHVTPAQSREAANIVAQALQQN